jgi:hypothetical protein
VNILPATARLTAMWKQYQTQFNVVKSVHKVTGTVMPAAFRQRFNAELVAISRAKLAVHENALATAKTTICELKHLLTADDLTGN